MTLPAAAIDRAAVRAAQLLFFAFALALAYRFVTVRYLHVSEGVSSGD